MTKLRKIFKFSSVGIVLLIIIVIIIRIGYMSFIDYRDLLIAQQQESLLTITKSISANIDSFLKQKVKSVSLLAKNPIIIKDLKSDQSKEVIKAFYTEYSYEIERILVLDKEGKIQGKYPEKNLLNKRLLNDNDVSYVLRTHEPYIGKAYNSYGKQYAINISQPIFDKNEFVGILVIRIEMNTLYNNLIFPIKADEKGYAMVKNSDGIILMHPMKTQVGTEAIKVRKEKYPQYDWSELEELSERQKDEAEGVAVYHSIWWQESELKWVKKLGAFNMIIVGADSWSISAQMAFSQIEKPIKESLKKILSIVLITISALIGVTLKVLQIKKNKDELELETRYLKELNKASEELQKSKARLLHAQKLETIGTLTGGIAHEFNNLLTPILGYSEIILTNTQNDQELYEDILEINRASKRAKEIIEQILMFSRSDELMSLFKQVRVSSVVKESIKLMETIVPQNIKLIKKINNNCGYIFANATQIQQVIMNLCTNSYHAMKEKGGYLEISVDRIEVTEENLEENNLQKGNYAKICVKDTGFGISKETLEQIFNPFFTTKEVGEGTGLGLSVVHGIINNHKGNILVDSEIGVGTTVCIYLPLVEEREIVISNKGKRKLSGEGSILLIDDDKSVLKVIKKGLTKCGYTVIAETNGFEAIKLLKKNYYLANTAILDYTMPNINGLELARKIKEINPNIKIILISGFIKDHDILSRYSNIIDDYMLKPILVNELVEKIKIGDN